MDKLHVERNPLLLEAICKYSRVAFICEYRAKGKMHIEATTY